MITDHRPLPDRHNVERCTRCGQPVDAHTAVTDREAFLVTLTVIAGALLAAYLLR